MSQNELTGIAAAERSTGRQMSSIKPCQECGIDVDFTGCPEGLPNSGWCSSACSDAWHAARPEEAAKWIKVEDMNAEQRAELDAMLGGHKGAA